MDSPISTHRLIAQEAGLSPTTVSLVLNNRAESVGIKLQTRQKVMEIAKRMNYVRNPLAAGLSGARTRTIGLLWSLAGPHSSEGMVRNLVLRAQKRGYMAHVVDSLSDPEVIERQLIDFRRRRVDGVAVQLLSNDALSPSIERQLQEFDAAVVVSPQAARGKLDWIEHDRLSAVRDAADHFADTGRKRPGILISTVGGAEKIQAFLGRCRQRGMAVGEESILGVRYSQTAYSRQEPLMAAYRRSLEERNHFDFDCLLCSTDEGAVVAMSWLRSLGLRVPQDVAIIGINNALFSQWLSPALASVDRRDEDVAATIEQMLFDRLEDGTAQPQRRTVAMRLLVRESAGGRSFQETVQ
jgi:LacI family transcriptional regulator